MPEDTEKLEDDLRRVNDLISEARAVRDEGEEPNEELYNLMGSYDDIEETYEVLLANREDIQSRLEAARQGQERPSH